MLHQHHVLFGLAGAIVLLLFAVLKITLERLVQHHVASRSKLDEDVYFAANHPSSPS